MTMVKPKQSLFCLLLSVVAFGDYAKAQDKIVGVDICACQPAVYEITLDFEVACKSANVGDNDQPGILETACRVTAEDTTDVTDFVPFAVQEIQFLELNANLQTLQQEVRRGSFRSNNKVQYTSVLAVKDEFDQDTLPAAVQVNMRGVNVIEQPLQMFWIIKYDNDCGVFPLLEVGQKQGWSIFTDLGSPPEFVCPLVGEGVQVTPPSTLPSAPPTESAAPSTAPTTSVLPTTMPSVSPSQSNAPSSTATEEPSQSSMPSTAPTGSMQPTTLIEEATTAQPTSGDCTDMLETCPVGGHKEESKNVFLHPRPSPHHGWPPSPPHHDHDSSDESSDEETQEPPDMIPICVQNRFLFWTSYETKCVDRHTFAQEGHDEQRLYSMFQCNSYTCGCCDPRDEGASYPSFCGGQICAQDPQRTFCKLGSGWGRGWGDRCDNYVAICLLHKHQTICVDELDHWFLSKTPGVDYTCGCCEEDDAEFCANNLV